MQALLAILSKPDNLPVVGLLVLVILFVGGALVMGHRNDRLVEREGREALVRRMRQ